jgi:hypothetical protein
MERLPNFGTLLAKMAEVKEAIGRQFQSLSIVFVCAVNTKLDSLFGFVFSLQIYMELSGSTLLPLIFITMVQPPPAQPSSDVI